MKHFILTGVISLLVGAGLSGQDIHFSQFDRSALNLNPAMTGLFNGDYRIHLNFRDQWESVPVPYLTVSGSFDARIAGLKIKSGILGGGLLFNYDRAGDSELSNLQLAGNAAYALKFNKRNYLSAGFQVLYGQRRFSAEQLTFDNQFNGDLFDPTLPTGESFSGMSLNYLDFSAGLNWHFQLSERTNFDIGAALFHLSEPGVSFFDTEDVVLMRKRTIYFNATIQLSPTIDILPGFLHQDQGPYNETIAGGSLRYHLNTNFGKRTALLLGGWTRLEDAVIVSAGLDYKNWRFGLSYDINTSDFNEATDGRGGPEFSLIHIITRVKPLESNPSCPIF